jgi:hypothetical protein
LLQSFPNMWSLLTPVFITVWWWDMNIYLMLSVFTFRPVFLLEYDRASWCLCFHPIVHHYQHRPQTYVVHFQSPPPPIFFDFPSSVFKSKVERQWQ